MDEGYLLAEVICGEAGKPVDVRYVDANPAATRLVGTDFKGRRLSEIIADYESQWWTLSRRVPDTGKPEHAELYAKPLNRWFGVSVSKLDDRRV